MIRLMTEEDLPAVEEIERLSQPAPWSIETFRKELNQPADSPFGKLYLVEEALGRIDGFCGSWNILDECHVTNIAVHPRARRTGVATRLIESLVSEVSEIGILYVTLEVRASNKKAIQLYERQGFKQIGIRPGYYRSNDEDALIMWLVIDEFVRLSDQKNMRQDNGSAE